MDRATSRVRRDLGPIAICVLLAAVGVSWGFPEYASDGQDPPGPGCDQCHGDFRAGGYFSEKDQTTWASSLMTTHENELDGDCDTCHTSPGRSPVFLGSSDGGSNLPGLSCAGCHGRAQDGTGTGSQGYGAGLRQHHWRADPNYPENLRICADCHTDADPAAKTTAGEHIAPPYFGDATHSGMPFDPCNPGPAFNENFEGTTLGLDNDGDGAYDQTDTDCGVQAGTPGEIPLVRVTAKNLAAGTITIDYTTTCQATDNTIEFGSLDQVSSYSYAGQECNIGNSGQYVWAYPSLPESLFILVVGNNGVVEGSYGIRTGPTERDEDTTSATCPLPRDITNRCD